MGKHFDADWGEIIGFVAAAGGALLALTTGSAMIAYVGALLTGFLFGIRWCNVKHGPKLHWYMIILGFAIGYSVGSIVYASWKIVIVCFAASMVAGYMMRKSVCK